MLPKDIAIIMGHADVVRLLENQESELALSSESIQRTIDYRSKISHEGQATIGEEEGVQTPPSPSS